MMEPQRSPEANAEPQRVLLLDHDEDIRDLVTAVLTDEGYSITALSDTSEDGVRAAVGREEPDCILLDATGAIDFGTSWSSAAYLANRARVVPTIMFTSHAAAIQEARDGTSERALAAKFAAILSKPFSLDELLTAVGRATGQSKRFDRSESGERKRTAVLLQELRTAGATDIRTGERREWATFLPPTDDRLHQLYWWQHKGVYMLGRYDADARLELIGHFFERQSAIDAALGTAPAA